MKRRDFLAGAAAGAAAAGVVGVAGRQIYDRVAGGGKPQIAYAQYGEDLILFALLKVDLGLTNPTYLDLGAGDPEASNNTYGLYLAGARGVLVEPNPTLVEKLRRVRPGDVVVAAGVGVTDETEADYFVIRDRWYLNTFSPDVVAGLRQASTVDPVERIIKMPLVNINRLIADHFKTAPDLMSIDIEGLDLAVLRTLDLKAHRPAVICSEAKKPWASHDTSPIAQLLLPQGYVACAGSLYNTIFVDRARLGV